jgi:peptide/nickel transport system ATP-binding protein
MTMTPQPPEPLLEVSHFSLRLPAPERELTVIDSLDLSVNRGERLALVGASGAGKSQLALAIAALSPAEARCQGSIRFEGQALTGAPAHQLRALRGARIGLIHQQPTLALAPHLTIGRQLMEVLYAHGRARPATARSAAIDRLESVGMPDPAAMLERYPHELSGGLLQRAMIAIALMGNPSLLIADEPTSGLDPSLQATVLTLLDRLCRSEGLGLIFITHDLSVAAALCERIAVMDAGRIVETGETATVLRQPQQACTRRLIAATAALGSRARP